MTTRDFTPEDQQAFAALSGDFNPLHVDALASRRLLFGAPVVHGIHALLWGLDQFIDETGDELEIDSLRVVFRRPLKVGEVALLARTDEGRFTITSAGGGMITVAANLVPLTPRDQLKAKVTSGLPPVEEPMDPPDEELVNQAGALDLFLDTDRAIGMFPRLARRLSRTHLAVLLASTRLVGMTCPGLHSLFSEMTIASDRSASAADLMYEVRDVDRRFGLLDIGITAPGLAGSVKAFRRPAPRQQVAFDTLITHVVRNEFRGQRALIVGGSRGLGEVAAKLLSAGGAAVKITYNVGELDAKRVVDEIESGGGNCSCVRLDVLEPQFDSLNDSVNGRQPTDLYYFATPFIFSGLPKKFSPELFRNFCDYYVIGVANIVRHATSRGVKRFFFPSTVAIEEIQPNLGEYAAAKAAGEKLCEFFESTNRELRIHRPRLPRLATDQTATVVPVESFDVAACILEQLRSFRDRE